MKISILTPDSKKPNGYKATFTEESHRELVTYLLAKVDGYSAMIQTLSHAINLIKKD